VSAKNLQCSIRTRVIIGDYRIYVFADVVQCVSEDKCFIANAGDSDQKWLWPKRLPLQAMICSPSRSCQLLVPSMIATWLRESIGTNDGRRAQ
jgi:hypothetical protein